MNIIFVQFIYHNIAESAHSKVPIFPDIIPIHTNAATHGDCLTKHKEDIRDWGYYPVKPKKAKKSKK